MYDAATMILLVIAAIAGVICALPVLGINMQVFGGKNMDSSEKPKVYARVEKWRAWIALALASLALTGVVISVYYHVKPHIVEKEVIKTVQEPYKFKWEGDALPTHQFAGKHFYNELVFLDDNSYMDCTFENVTFVYNGTGSFGLVHNTIRGNYKVRSDNPAVNTMVQILYGLGMMTKPVINLNTDRPLENIHPSKLPSPKQPQ